MSAHPHPIPDSRNALLGLGRPGLCGEGYRLDHQPLLIVQDGDSEGFNLHGGPVKDRDGHAAGAFNPELQYRCVNGQQWTSLLAISVQLCDHNPGDGGASGLRARPISACPLTARSPTCTRALMSHASSRVCVCV